MTFCVEMAAVELGPVEMAAVELGPENKKQGEHMQIIQITEEIKSNNLRLEEINKEIKKLTKGYLIVEKNIRGEHVYTNYRHAIDGERHSIKMNTTIMHSLSRKAYLEAESKIIQENNKALSKLLLCYKDPIPSTVYETLPDKFKGFNQSMFLPMESPNKSRLSNGGPLIGYTANDKYQVMNYNRLKPGERPVKQYRPNGRILDPRENGFEQARQEWALEPYFKSNYYPEDLTQPISAGFNVRTKNEAMIGERLSYFKVPFRYEEVLFVEGSEFPRYPDFKLIDIYGMEVFWEHCGLMDDEEYLHKHKKKLEEYESMGIVPWKNLIVTYSRPNGSLDIKMIDAIIKARFVR